MREYKSEHMKEESFQNEFSLINLKESNTEESTTLLIITFLLLRNTRLIKILLTLKPAADDRGLP